MLTPALLLLGLAQGAAGTVDTALAGATFDSAWVRIHRTFFDTTFGGRDWVALRDTLRPRAVAVADEDGLRTIIAGMLQRLGQSHFALIPRENADVLRDDAEDPPGADDGVPGLEVRRIAGPDGAVALVTRVREDGGAAAAGVRPGWTVVAVAGRAVDSLDARLAALGADRGFRPATFLPLVLETRLAGPAGSAVPVTFRTAAGDTVTVEIERRPHAGRPARFGNLPPQYPELSTTAVQTPAGRTAAVIRFNVWMPAIVQPFARAVDAHRDAAGLVIDLRGNPGGVAGLIMGLGGHFLRARDTLGTMRARDNSLHFIVNPQRIGPDGRRVEPYAGPLAILTDALSMSTSEFFAGGFQTIGRARVFGDTTAGQALPAVIERMPNGDLLMYAIADYTAPDGRRLEGHGVVPDELVIPAPEVLQAGRDPVLAAALRWIDTATATTEKSP